MTSSVEIITAIEKGYVEERPDDDWIGIKITTNKQEIKVLINDFQSCCEQYDVLILSPNCTLPIPDIIGHEIKNVGWGKEIVNNLTCQIGSLNFYNETLQESAIVNIETNKGLYQIIAYNDHNGYYQHSVCVEWNGYSDTQYI